MIIYFSRTVNLGFGSPPKDKVSMLVIGVIYFVPFFSRTVNLGFGTPPKDKVSMLVIGVISAGLGIPVVLIIFGGVCVFIKRRTAAKKGYEKLNGTTTERSSIQ